MMNGAEGHGWYMGIGMGWWWLIGIAIFILVTWFIVKNVNIRNRPYFPGNKSAIDLLKERYAKGEIDKEEFEKRKKDLLQ